MKNLRLLTVREAAKRCGISRTKVYELLAEGQFPRPCRIGARAVRWRSDEIEQFIERLSAERAA